jgi:hypothetical protein
MQHVDIYCAQENHNHFFKNYIPWYHSNDYQQWAIHNLNKIVRMKNKSIAKQYIHTVSKDQCYLNFKTKVNSVSRIEHQDFYTLTESARPRTHDKDSRANTQIFCVLSNGDCLYLDQHFDQIVELLPQHINLESLNYLN